MLVVVAGLWSGGLTPLRAEPAKLADDVLYEDEAARSSATVTQVMPDSSKTLMTLDAVRRIRIKQEILIIEWGNTVTTLLPRKFISSMTINKRAPAAETRPAGS
jgi:hypothetical protein